MKKLVSKVQGVYYLITGVWPIIHIGSFMAVTGPKIDLWLVKMVGLLSISIAITLLLQIKNTTNYTLNILTAISFLVIDVYYVFSDTISPIYLADAVLQGLFILLICIPVKKSATI